MEIKLRVAMSFIYRTVSMAFFAAPAIRKNANIKRFISHGLYLPKLRKHQGKPAPSVVCVRGLSIAAYVRIIHAGSMTDPICQTCSSLTKINSVILPGQDCSAWTPKKRSLSKKLEYTGAAVVRLFGELADKRGICLHLRKN